MAPGVEHAFFAPGDRRGARRALGLGDHPMLLFVGRIQPLKGVDVAVRALAALRRPDAVLVIVGGASGADGDAGGREGAPPSSTSSASPTGCASSPPQPHHLLSSYYRAADVVLVPRRSESFGLVALEAAACGTPVVAPAVGGLLTLVDHGHTGFLVPGPRRRGLRRLRRRAAVERPAGLGAWRGAPPSGRAGYTWSTAAARLRRLYADLTVGALVDCSMSEASTTRRDLDACSSADRRLARHGGRPRTRRSPPSIATPRCRAAGTCA